MKMSDSVKNNIEIAIVEAIKSKMDEHIEEVVTECEDEVMDGLKQEIGEIITGIKNPLGVHVMTMINELDYAAQSKIVENFIRKQYTHAAEMIVERL